MVKLNYFPVTLVIITINIAMKTITCIKYSSSYGLEKKQMSNNYNKCLS